MAISAILEGARNENGNLSLWRVPNMLFEPRGLYLGESDKMIGRLNKWRSAAAVVILAAIAFRYNQVYTTVKKHRHGRTYINVNIGQKSAATSWVLNSVTAIAVSAAAVTVISVIIVLATHKEMRKVAAKQLCWPLITMVVFVAYMALIGSLIGLLNSKIIALSGVERFALELVGLCTVGVWFIKSLYLVATGLFRADDGHPLLAPVTVPIVAWIFALFAMLGSAPSGVPHTIDLLTLWAGPISVTALSAFTALRLWRQHKTDFPFRNGPLPRKVQAA